MENILREVTPELIEFTRLISGKSKIGCNISGKTELYNEQGVTVQRVSMRRGTKLDPHRHPEKVMLIVYEGVLSIKIESSKRIVYAGDIITINPEATHSIQAVNDVKMIVLVVPSGEGCTK